MHDPNMRDFYQRVGRIERTHASGGGFEAAGTLGMSYYNALKVQKRRGGWILPLAAIALTIIGIKAAVLSNVGAAAYEARLEALRTGDAADRIGAYVLQADPLTHLVAGMIGN